MTGHSIRSTFFSLFFLLSLSSRVVSRFHWRNLTTHRTGREIATAHRAAFNVTRVQCAHSLSIAYSEWLLYLLSIENASSMRLYFHPCPVSRSLAPSRSFSFLLSSGSLISSTATQQLTQHYLLPAVAAAS